MNAGHWLQGDRAPKQHRMMSLGGAREAFPASLFSRDPFQVSETGEQDIQRRDYFAVARTQVANRPRQAFTIESRSFGRHHPH